MKQLLLFAAISCASVLAFGCGGDDDTESDAAVVIDAAPDASDVDASGTTACEVLCSCMDEYCSQAVQECMTDCMMQQSATISCRITHCGYAQSPGGGPIHCPHALGDENEPTTPPDCIGQ